MATGLGVLLRLPDGTSDLTIAREILAFGMFPAPLSPWYAFAETSRSGLLLGVATSPTKELARSEEHTSELQSLMRISYAVFCLKKKTKKHHSHQRERRNTSYALYRYESLH